MASTYSSSLRFDLQGTGDNDGTWGTVANVDFALIDAAIASVASIAMVNGNNTLSTANGTADQARCATLKLSGALTSAAAVVIPDLSKQYVVYNGTTGGQVITVRNSAGTGIAVPAGTAMQVWCDGTSVRPASPATNESGALVLTTLAADVGNIVDISASSANIRIGTFARINCSLTVSASAVYVNGQTNTSTLNVRGLATIVNMDASGTVSAGFVKASTGAFTGAVNVATTVSAATVVGNVIKLGATSIGTMAIQDATSVNITGGTITGVTGLITTGVSTSTVPVFGVGNGLIFTQASISDEGVALIPLPSSNSLFAVKIVPSIGSAGNMADVMGRTGNVLSKQGSGAGVSVYTGALGGTTGTNGLLNISTATSILYVENRLGFNGQFLIMLYHGNQ